MKLFHSRRTLFGLALLAFYGGLAGVALAVELPAGFQQTIFAGDLHDPNAIEFSPDGRLFVAERISGRLRVVHDGRLLDEPFVTVNVPPEKAGKREEAAQPGFRYQGIYHYGTYRSAGLRGLAFDPEFEQNGYLYVYYMSDRPRVNRVSRFTASRSNPNVAEPGSEKVLLDIAMHAGDSIAPVPDGGSHNGGALLFGADGKLYVSVGDGWNPAPRNAPQDLSNLIGKVLRIDRDGSAPADNPFRDTPGSRPEIWAVGFRNPYTMALHPRTGDIYINDVVWGKETVYKLVRGGNYRHPSFQGKGAEQYPLHTAAGLIAGGAWYFGEQFPEKYRGSYFLSDWRGNLIRRLLSEQDPKAEPFAVGAAQPTYIKVGPDGALYWLSTNYETLRGRVNRISWRGESAEEASAPAPAENFDAYDGLISHWPLDDGMGELARDISKEGRHGRMIGEITWEPVARPPRGITWGKGGGRVELGDLELTSERFTITAWIRPDSFLPGMADNRILSKATGPNEGDHWWMLGSVRSGNSVRLRFRLKAGGRTSTLIATAGELKPGAWTHVAAVYDGRAMHLFQDGEPVGIIGKAGAPDRSPGAGVWLGDNPPNAGSRPFHGAMRDIRIYNKALTAGEMTALMKVTNLERGNAAGRVKVLESYKPALRLTGDPESGRLIFQERCVACHRQEDGHGVEIAPDLTDAASKGKAWLLESIVDPRRETPPPYWSYTVATENASLTGVISTETRTHITIRTLDGQERWLDRASIRSFRRESQSLMPDGLETGLTPQDVASLLEYLVRMKPLKTDHRRRAD